MCRFIDWLSLHQASRKQMQVVIALMIKCDNEAPTTNLHCAKSHRSFELLANANWIVSFRMKPKWMWHLREVWLRIPRRNPLSAEMNDASTWRIGVPVVHFVMTLCHNDSPCCAIWTKPCSELFVAVETCSRCSTHAIGFWHCDERPSSLLVKDCASDNFSHTAKSAGSVNESRTNETCLRMLWVSPIPSIANSLETCSSCHVTSNCVQLQQLSEKTNQVIVIQANKNKLPCQPHFDLNVFWQCRRREQWAFKVCNWVRNIAKTSPCLFPKQNPRCPLLLNNFALCEVQTKVFGQSVRAHSTHDLFRTVVSEAVSGVSS